MTDYEEQFLFLFKCAVNGEKAPEDYSFDAGRVFSLAALHNVLPLIYNAVPYRDELFPYKRNTVRLTGLQIRKNMAFSSLYRTLTQAGLSILVLKGPVCAALYPAAELRLASDFDLIVPDTQRQILHEKLLSLGYTAKSSSYLSKTNGLYLEIDTALGEGSETMRKAVNALFDGFWSRKITLGGYATLSFTDNMLYLLYHAFKHFIGSGFGVRQMADCMLFAQAYRADIDFDAVFEKLKSIHADGFALHVFSAAQTVFGCDLSYILEKRARTVPLYCDDFLDDLLSAGVFGKSSEDRLHSAAAVTAAVETQGKQSFVRTLFPPYSVMKTRSVFLRIFPFLLPLFWLFRLAGYGAKLLFKKNKLSPVNSVKIAQDRMQLMRKMGILK